MQAFAGNLNGFLNLPVQSLFLISSCYWIHLNGKLTSYSEILFVMS